MDIQREIVEYLETHDFVLLPGIGGLTADYTLPFIDKDSNIIASKRVIKLLPFLDKEADAGFLNSLKEKHHLTQNTVQNAYISFLESFNKTIIKHGSYDWEGLGKFTFNPQANTYQFEQTDEVSLKSVDIQVNVAEQRFNPIKSEVSKAGANQVLEQSPVNFKQEQKVLEVSIDEPDYPDSEYPEEPVIEKKTNWLLYLLPLVLLFAAFVYTVFIKPISKKSVLEEETTEEVVITGEEVTEVKPLEFQGSEEESRTIVSNEEVVSSTEGAIEHIVRIGYFRNNEEADEVATYLAENGYPSRVRASGRMFKVFLVARNDNQALQYVEEVKELINENPIYENQIKGE